MNVNKVFATSREQMDVYRFSFPVTVLAPLLAILFQTFVSGRFAVLAIFDLPLLVTIFFGVSRRKPVIGLLQGGFIGLVQDAFTQHPIGVYGIAKTIIGYMASSIGGKIDVENPGSRLLMTFVFYLAHHGIYVAIARGMLGTNLDVNYGHVLLAAVLNGALAVVLFAMLDRFKQRA